MIIFYDKITGAIVGTINGRAHGKDHMKVWIGDKSTTERLVVGWRPFKYYDKDGKEVAKGAKNKKGEDIVFAADFEPDHEQRDLFMQLDERPSLIYQYKIDMKTKNLVKKQ